ncbi:hypothetical protein NDU88_007321 [Pleurodeles waltl]|uniref:PiggyBac transposable element-derived protein domain-containing protein n=1 Tax=Pleurodeles waltl TaxID=8319 RepID=A0AAV7PP03_PLEWA|nr:hypothetical protein NDU88_007321 [Pleurodeles waltl]
MGSEGGGATGRGSGKRRRETGGDAGRRDPETGPDWAKEGEDSEKGGNRTQTVRVAVGDFVKLRFLERIMASPRVTAQQVVGMLFESSSDHDYETDSASEAEEEVRDSGSEFPVQEESSDEEATLSADEDEGPVLEEDTDVPIVQQPGTERFPIGRPDTWVAPNMNQPQLHAFICLPGFRVNTESFLPVNFFELFMDNVFLEEIVEQTNLYADQFVRDNAARLRPQSRATQWIPTNLDEMKKFLGLTFLMGLIRKPSLASYWSTSPLMARLYFLQP